MTAAFDSAGQRCSAARILFVQSDIADKVHATCWPARWTNWWSAIPACCRPTSAR